MNNVLYILKKIDVNKRHIIDSLAYEEITKMNNSFKGIVHCDLVITNTLKE